jgi:hypothetical protein
MLATDSSIAVRREVAISLRDIPLTRCRETLIQLASSYHGNDRWFLEALGIAFDGRQDEIYPLFS